MPAPGRHATLRGDRGSAVVDFVLVVPLLLVVALAVIHVALFLQVRATLTAAAAEGARAAALAGADPEAGVSRARALLEGDLSASVVRRVAVRRSVVDGLPVISLLIDAQVPTLGLLGATDLTVEGHALVEGPA